MSARVTRRFDPSLLLRTENPMCLSDAKCVEWLFHSAHSSDVAQPLRVAAAASATNVVAAQYPHLGFLLSVSDPVGLRWRHCRLHAGVARRNPRSRLDCPRITRRLGWCGRRGRAAVAR